MRLQCLPGRARFHRGGIDGRQARRGWHDAGFLLRGGIFLGLSAAFDLFRWEFTAQASFIQGALIDWIAHLADRLIGSDDPDDMR